jgi:hypothetical protein
MTEREDASQIPERNDRFLFVIRQHDSDLILLTTLSRASSPPHSHLLLRFSQEERNTGPGADESRVRQIYIEFPSVAINSHSHLGVASSF